MAAWPIQFLKGSRPGKRPHLPDVQTNDDKRRLYEKEKHPERSFQPKSKEMWLMSMRIQTIWLLLLTRLSQRIIQLCKIRILKISVMRKRMMRLLRNSSLSRQKQKTAFTLLQQKNKIIKFYTNKIVLKSLIA